MLSGIQEEMAQKGEDLGELSEPPSEQLPDGFIENDDGKEEQVENPDKGHLLDENDDGNE